jgi:hypothetical protein
VPIYVKKNNEFEQPDQVSRECPHCGRNAELVPVATPSFQALTEARPRHAGIAFRCGACGEPRFARAAIRHFGTERIVLSSHLVEIERPRERFQFAYLPPDVERLFREALDCYTADLFTAFAVMCRRAIQAAQAGAPRSGAPQLFDLFADVADITELDAETSQTIETVLFEPETTEPAITAEQAAVLIEVIKDIFRQRYVRTAKLKAAMKMRRFFAEESAHNVTPIASLDPRASQSRSGGRAGADPPLEGGYSGATSPFE